MFLNHTRLTSGPIALEANVDYRLKLEHQHSVSTNWHYLQWIGPFATETEATSSSASFVTISDEHFLHAVVCPDECSGRGCCRADGRCSCEPGYGGNRCEIRLDSCGDDAPSGPLVTGGLTARFFSNNDFTNKVGDYTYDRAYLGYGSLPSGVPRDTFSVRFVGRLLAVATGWHTIGVTSNSRSVARVIIDGVELYNWYEDWSAPFFMTKGESYGLTVELKYVAWALVEQRTCRGRDNLGTIPAPLKCLLSSAQTLSVLSPQKSRQVRHQHEFFHRGPWL